MLESDKGKHVLPVGKLPPERERIMSWERTHSRLPRCLRWGGDMNYCSAPRSPSKTDLLTKFFTAAWLGEVCGEDGCLAGCAGVVQHLSMAWEAAG